MPEGWEDQWEIVKEVAGEGGQGTVSQVRKKSDGTLGALKRLHPQHLTSTKRRLRMQVEVNSLRALDGNGTPGVLDTNVDLWEDKSVRLYLVMEWVEGPTLSQYVQGSPLPLDDALIVTADLLDTIEACHLLDIFHRDLKADNTILRHKSISDPMLVDFGMSWAKPPDDETQDLITESGDEIGNRFLRLPEHAPGLHIHDARSDLTVLVGLLLYMITGKQPHRLEDATGRMPHQFLADYIRRDVTDDPRWAALDRLFRIGFQTNIDQRFQSSNQLREFIERLNNPGSEQDEQTLALDVATLNDMLNSPQVLQAKLAEKQVPKAMRAMREAFLAGAKNAGFDANFDGSFIAERDVVGSNALFGIYKSAYSIPGAQGDHQIRLEGNMYVAYYRVEPFAGEEHYRGSALDPESLEDAVRGIVPRILSKLTRVYSDRLREKFKIAK
jgi:serine/threonine protein kinase